MGNLLNQWLASVFSHPDLPGALAIAAKTAVIYIFLIAGLRLLGKRELGQMSVYDLVLVVVIANAVQNAMVGDDNTLFGGLVSALTLLIMNRAFTWLMVRQTEFRHMMLGEPVLLVRDGRLLQEPMKQEGVTREGVLASMREHGIGSLDDVQIAVLEVDGTISIVPKQTQVHRSHHRVRGLRVQ